MPTISLEDVAKIAALARLGLTATGLKQAAADLEQVLQHFAVIQNIDTEEVAASEDVTGKSNVSREDVEKADDLSSAGELLSRAPDQADEQIKVRAIFED